MCSYLNLLGQIGWQKQLWFQWVQPLSVVENGSSFGTAWWRKRGEDVPLPFYGMNLQMHTFLPLISSGSKIIYSPVEDFCFCCCLFCFCLDGRLCSWDFGVQLLMNKEKVDVGDNNNSVPVSSFGYPSNLMYLSFLPLEHTYPSPRVACQVLHPTQSPDLQVTHRLSLELGVAACSSGNYNLKN